MDQLYGPNDSNELAREIGEFLSTVGGEEVVAIDIARQSGFADVFVIASVESTGRLKGLYRQAFEKITEMGMLPRQSRKRDDDESGWLLLDCDSIVVHLMLTEMRQFYELEKLWFDGQQIYPAL